MVLRRWGSGDENLNYSPSLHLCQLKKGLDSRVMSSYLPRSFFMSCTIKITIKHVEMGKTAEFDVFKLFVRFVKETLRGTSGFPEKRLRFFNT